MNTRVKVATAGLAVPTALALVMSTNTSYRFLGDRLGIVNPWERGPLCGAAEAAILAFTVYSWATGRKGPAWLAYAMVLVQAVPGFSINGGTGGIIRVTVGPVLLAVTLHLLLGLEVKAAGVRPDTLLRRAWSEVRERLTAYLGIGRRGIDSEAIARSRAADRAVALADRLERSREGSRAYRRRSARLADAIDAARHGLSEAEAAEVERRVVGRVVRRKSVASLASIPARHDWLAAVPVAVAEPVPARVPVEGGTPGTEVPPTVPARVPVEVPAPVPPVVPAQVPAEPVRGTTADAVPAPVDGTAAELPRNTGTEGPAGPRPALEVVRNAAGTRAEHIRALVADGVTDTGTIRNLLRASGIEVPSDRYIRRLVGESRNTGVPEQVPPTGTGQYM